MILRAAIRSVQLPLGALAPLRTSPSAAASPERPVRPEYPGKVRLGFIPEEWFQCFYNKTGVTGPYTFGVGLTANFNPKELYVMEHGFYTGGSLAIMAVVGASCC